MPFDPDKFLAETSTFDPDKFLAETEPDNKSIPPEKPVSYAEAAAPRQSALPQDAGLGQQAAAATGDVLSFVGRVLSTAFKGRKLEDIDLDEEMKMSFKEKFGRDWDEFKKGLAQKESDLGGVGGFVENVVRDPATVATLPLGGGKVVGTAVKKAVSLLGKGAAEGGASAAAHQAESVASGEDASLAGAAAEVGLSTAMGPAAKLTKGLIKGIIKAPKAYSDKILDVYLKAPNKIYKDGLDVKNIDKYDLYGYTEQIADKAQKAIDVRYNEVKSALAESGASGKKVDFYKAIDEAVGEIEKNKTKFPALFEADIGADIPLKKASYRLLNTFDQMTDGALDVDPLKANELKQVVGEMGAAAFGKNTKEDDAMEALAMVTYGKLRNQIDNSTSGRVKLLNKEISELIPIKMAAMRRLPIEKRNEFFSIKEFGGMAASMATGNPLPLSLSLSDRLLKNPYAAKILNRISRIEKPALSAGSKITKATEKPLRQAVRTGLFSGFESE
ncbi:MAG: hypothetical protein PHN44_00085 [Candidatus Marinimicrobia bacterium]|nr:hypothetical protein [Candidatus Neomarinimicrobiota bacterium]